MNNLLKEKIKTWMKSEFPDDELVENMSKTATFEDLMTALKEETDVYKVLGYGDSVLRERAFDRLCEIIGIDYMIIWKMWINS